MCFIHANYLSCFLTRAVKRMPHSCRSGTFFWLLRLAMKGMLRSKFRAAKELE